MQPFGNNVEVYRLDVIRTLRYNDYLGAVLPAGRFAQSSRRQQDIITKQPVVVGQQNIHSRLYVAMLESIIQQHCIHSGTFQFKQLLDTMTAVFIYRHPYVRKLAFYLIRFVTDFLYTAFGGCQYIPFTFSFVAAAQCRHIYALTLQ